MFCGLLFSNVHGGFFSTFKLKCCEQELTNFPNSCMDLEIYILFWSVELSIVPLLSNWKNEQDCLGLRAVDGSSSNVWHPVPHPGLGLWCVFHWIFVIADNSTPIIEVNFLQEHGFLVNMRHGFIMNMLAYLQVKILFFILYHPAHLSNCSKVTKNVIP